MGLSDVLRGWISREESAGDENGSADALRGPASTDADAVEDGGGDSDADAGPETVVYECRNCGTTVSAGTETCPTCGSEAIAEYPIE